MRSGRGQKRPAGDSGQKRKMRKANARTAPGRVNRPGKAVNPAQDRPAQKRISDEGPPGSKRLRVADKMPGAKRKKDPPLPTPQDFCRGDASAETEGTYVEKGAKPWNGEPQYGAASIGAKVRVRTLVERFDTERYSDLFFSQMIKLYTARSLLYRRQSWQEHIRWQSS